ncbi:conserved Plasmodium protein, unknown function [Plasmodium ovale wallikeri]|uniref:SprT-like domain-containing protein n=1 Tax=Plasmodium ovale wallikeri TaxID=864142 RepID=A0A1A8Z993_PLAOA|nr:conserved Plasmodium protein, unknown function [Plasmodium ovale wallikeri]
MDGEITKLTSVENEYLQKSGKKRRQKSLIDVSSLNDLGDEHKMGSFPGAPFSSSDNVSLGEPKKSCAEVSTELQSESGDDEEEDPDTQAVMRQLSSIQIESDRESSSSDNGNNDKDIRDDKKGNDTDMVVFNKKENTNSKKEKKKKKKGGEKKGAIVYEPFDVECVEDAVVYDESKDTEFPDLQELFCEYNARYFFDKLKSVQVKWSNKMKLCAGICVYKVRYTACTRQYARTIVRSLYESYSYPLHMKEFLFGKLPYIKFPCFSFFSQKSGYCCIRLSLPLLKLRKIKEYRVMSPQDSNYLPFRSPFVHTTHFMLDKPCNWVVHYDIPQLPQGSKLLSQSRLEVHGRGENVVTDKGPIRGDGDEQRNVVTTHAHTYTYTNVHM